MALTYTNLHRRSIGADYLLVEELHPAASDYATGGYALVFPEYNEGIIKAVWAAGSSENAITAFVNVAFNYQTGKLQAFGGAASGVAGAEFTNGGDLSAYTFVVCAIGK